jgi:hypothetical protein
MKDQDQLSARRQGRREFLKAGGAVTAALLAQSAMAEAPKTLPALPSNPVTPSAMPTRNLGKTGYKVGIFSLGGQAALEQVNNFDVAVPIVERALDLGVNYIDTSSIYGGPDRWSEQYVGKVMAHRRNMAFLATKTKERTRDGSMRMIEKSLELLQTDHVDLWQLHDIGTMTDVDEVFAKGGAMEALLEMKEQKVVRFLGLMIDQRRDARRAESVIDVDHRPTLGEQVFNMPSSAPRRPATRHNPRWWERRSPAHSPGRPPRSAARLPCPRTQSARAPIERVLLRQQPMNAGHAHVGDQLHRVAHQPRRHRGLFGHGQVAGPGANHAHGSLACRRLGSASA